MYIYIVQVSSAGLIHLLDRKTNKSHGNQLFNYPYLIVPYHTSYYILHWIVHPSYLMLPQPTTTFFVLHWIVQPSYLIIPYHTSYYILHWSVQPSYLIVPYHTSYHILHWIVHPSYPILPQPFRPTLDCSAILPYRTLSYILPHPTLDCSSLLPQPTTTFFVLHWIVQPSYLIVPYHTHSTLDCYNREAGGFGTWPFDAIELITYLIERVDFLFVHLAI